MTRALLEAINIQAKREGFFWPVLRAIVFEQLANNYPAKHLVDILGDHRGGSWGADQRVGLLPAASLRSPDIRHGSIDFSQAEIRHYTSNELKKHRLADGDILVIKSNGSLDLVGKSQLFSTAAEAPPVTASNFVLVLTPDRAQVDPTYLDCFLKSPQALVWRVDKQRTTTGLRNLDTEGYLATSVPLPPTRATQNDIVDLISAIGEGHWRENPHFDIRLAQRAKKVSNAFEKLEEEDGHQQSLLAKLKQAILQEAIKGKLTTDWRAAHPAVEPASQLLQRMQAEKARLIAAKKLRPEKPLPRITSAEISFEIPKTWKWCRLGQGIRLLNGNSFESGDFRKGTGVKCVKITNAGVGEFVETDDALPVGFDKIYAKYQVFSGDLILALTRPYIATGLKISRCPESYDGALLNQRVAAIRPFEGLLNADYAFLFLSSDFVLHGYQAEFESKGQQPNLKSEHVTHLRLPLPPFAEQAAIVEQVEALMTTCRALETETEHTRTHAAQLLQAVLKEAFAPAAKSVAEPAGCYA